MKDACKIYLVRHGESIGNLNLLFLGHTDLDLSELGYVQARATADFLSDVKLDAIYSSDLKRAYNTAKAHADIRGLKVIADEELREAYLGLWENLSVDAVKAGWRELYEVDWQKKFGTFAFPEGESVIGAGKRFYAAVERIARQNMGKTVLIGSHGAVIRSFWALASGIAPEEIAGKLSFPTNASFSTLTYDGEKFITEKYSSDAHLAGIGITNVNF